MKKIAVITRAEKNCGIHGYTISALRILQTSKEYEYQLYPCDLPFRQQPQLYIDWLNNIDADAFLYNFCPLTMPWLTKLVLESVVRPHFIISGHDAVWLDLHNNKDPIHQWQVPCHVWSVDPDWQGLVVTPNMVVKALYTDPTDILYEANNFSALPRPVPVYPELEYHAPGDIIKIGTFGLSAECKNYDKIVERVCKDFSEHQVELTIRATPGIWVGIDGKPYDNSVGHDLAERATQLATPNVTVNVTHEFINDQRDLAIWLNSLDLIVFLYDPFWGRAAVSSSLDHALAARKPIAVNDSKMFSHVRHIPEIYMENRSLKQIMNQGITPLLPLYDKFSYNRFIDAIESKIKKFV